jgi:hypothetical protein
MNLCLCILNSALNGGELSAPRRDRITPKERLLRTHSTECRVAPGVNLDAME